MTQFEKEFFLLPFFVCICVRDEFITAHKHTRTSCDFEYEMRMRPTDDREREREKKQEVRSE